MRLSQSDDRDIVSGHDARNGEQPNERAFDGRTRCNDAGSLDAVADIPSNVLQRVLGRSLNFEGTCVEGTILANFADEDVAAAKLDECGEAGP